jgi:putative membrane-bound dehydrogenase-like protein
MFRLALLAAMSVAGPIAAQTRDVELNGHTFTLPKGFTIELAAGADLAPRPIAAAFDEKGRLYVTDSSGSNEKVQVQLEKKPHRVLRLEDTDGDGRFDKQTVFVKSVMLPQGAMWRDGSLYVAAPPHILKFTDTDDDGVADKEEVWFDGKTLTGCANDLHGPYPGPDGMIYWTKGAFAEQTYTVNGKKWTTRAAHIFRATPDGKNIEPVMTGGMDNPVDLVFTPSGDLIFSTTFFQHPAGGRRDGLVHAVYGGVYGKDHGPAREHPLTGPDLLPPLTHLGPAAPCGLHRYESDQFGPEYADNLFCCQFNLRKVSRHVLVPKGSTYETKDSDFVVSDNLDFHPTDVIEDADGSLLVVDTGGWYKLCCPTSQLVKPDVTGAIYRVKRDGAHKVDDPRGLKLDWAKAAPADLGKRLADPRPAVRGRAVAALAPNTEDNGEAVWEAIVGGPPPARANAIWAACRNTDQWRRRMCRHGFEDPDPTVRAAAVRAASLTRDAAARPRLVTMLTGGSPGERRAAAEALGRVGDPKAVPALLDALADEKNDRALDHALTYALIEIGDPKATRDGLTRPTLRVRAACLAALENMPDGKLVPDDVLPHLHESNAAVRETAWWVAGRHPEWGDRLAGYFRERLERAGKMTPEQRDDLADRLGKFVRAEAVQQALADTLGDPAAAAVALRVMARSGLKAMPTAWRTGLLAAAPTLDGREAYRAALAVYRAIPAPEKDFDAFLAAAPRATLWPTGVIPDEFRLAALAARPAGHALAAPAAGYLVGKLRRDEDAADRAAAADALSRAALTADQLTALAAALKAANPLELPKLVAVFAQSTDEAVGLALVKALRDPAVRPLVRAEAAKPVLDKYPKAVRDEAEKLYADLAEARKDERAKLEKVLAELKPGDVRRGQVVFNSAKASCVACHKVGYVGGTAGPDLTKIGGVRAERDLLEAILFPSASFVRSYEPVRVVTTDDRVLNGVLRSESADEVVVAVAADREERVPRAEVASMAPSTVSLMPGGLDQQLTPQELADLLAFLKACR